MSRSYSPEMEAHVQGDTTLAHCVTAVLKNGTIYGFTSYPADLVISGITYVPGFTPSSISTSAKLNVDNLEIQGALIADAIDKEDLFAGLWDFAEITFFEVNYEDLSMGIKDARRGWLGEVRTGRQVFIAEWNSLAKKLQQTIGELYSVTCRAKLGDARCKTNLTAFTFPGTVDAVTSNRQFTDAALTQADGYFDGGELIWTSGLNVGLTMQVKTYTVGAVLLQLPMPYAVQATDAYNIVAGCNGVFRDIPALGIIGHCISKFNNGVNFQAEPDAPDVGSLYENPA